MKHKFVTTVGGEFIDLQKVTVDDAEFIYELRTSKGAQYLNQPPNYSISNQREWIEKRTADEINYIIYSKDGERVGMVSIYDCDWSNRVSNVGRLLLKEQFIHASTPFGLEALLITYDYVFYTMGFRKIAGTINSRNEKVVSLQKHLGMIEEGYFRGHVLLDGEPQDLYWFALFKEDFPGYSAKIYSLLNKFRI